MTKDDVKSTVRIATLASEAGYKLSRGGSGEQMCICPSPDHNDSNASCSINDAKNLFQCHGCGVKGDVINWVMMVEGCDFKSALDKLGVDEDDRDTAPMRKPESHAKRPYEPPKAKDVPEATSRVAYKPESQYRTASHLYKMSDGDVKYKSVRYDYPDGTKSFQLIHRGSNGQEVFGMKDVVRIPYNYDEFQTNDSFFFVEGEKCADKLAGIGLNATTICGGSKAWIKEYAEYFKGKVLILIPDNDKTGREFMKQVASDCADTATAIRFLDIFTELDYESKWDVADEIDEMTDGRKIEYAIELQEKATLAPLWVKGVQIDGADAEQLNIRLRERYISWQGGGLDLKAFLPILSDKHLRPLVGGDMLVINASTGAGKTAFAQNLALFYNDRPIPWFTLELAETRMHERNLILSHEISGDEVERRILEGENLNTHAFGHIHVYDNAMASIDYIDKQISLMPLKTGEKPRLVIVDYIQLMPAKHPAMSTVQKIETNAVELKVLAKKHNLIICVLSQIGRKDEANLGASKGSGAIEESATMLIGLNHVEDYSDVKSLGVYKNSNGESGFSENIGWEGQFYKFSCTASARMLQSEMDDETDREEEPDETECPF